ncbi:10533_t:CDS:2, partial [Cetraspora pellucida]
NFETGTSYTVNAEVSIPYTVMIDQVANIENSTFYMFTAKVITFGAVNAKFSTFYAVNVQPNSSYMIDIKTNTLCKNATLDSQLGKETEWNHFFKYQTLLSCVEIASVSSKILSAINHILLEYLTSQILSIEYIEMAQCLYFDVTLVNLTVIRLDNENKNINDRFTEDVYDVKQILLKSMISKVDQINIKETWQITDK